MIRPLAIVLLSAVGLACVVGWVKVDTTLFNDWFGSAEPLFGLLVETCVLPTTMVALIAGSIRGRERFREAASLKRRLGTYAALTLLLFFILTAAFVRSYVDRDRVRFAVTRETALGAQMDRGNLDLCYRAGMPESWESTYDHTIRTPCRNHGRWCLVPPGGPSGTSCGNNRLRFVDLVRGDRPGVFGFRLSIPLLPVVLVMGVLAWRCVHLVHIRTSTTACLECGYDLTANESGVCPECGAACGIRA